MHSSKPALGFILITLFLDVLGFGLLIPVGPRLVQQLQGPTGTEATAQIAVSLLATTYATMQFIFAPLLGVLSDKVGRRPVILIALFGSGLDYFVMALAPTLSWFFVTRVVNGISGASMTAASAYIADITPPEKRAGAFGMIGAAFGLGFIFGPLIGGWLGSESTNLYFGHGHIHLPFYVAGAVTLLNWLYGFFVLPESLPSDRRAPFRASRANPIGAIPSLARYPSVLGLAIAMFFMNLAMFGLHVTWVLYMTHRHHWDSRAVGLSLFAVGVGAAVVQAGLARKVVPKLGERRALLLGVAIGVLSYLGYALAPEGWMIYAIIALGSFGGIAQPAGQSLITRTVSPTEQGAVQGALTSLQSVAAIFGPMIGGSVFAYSIGNGAPFMPAGSTFLVGAALCAVGWCIAAWATRHVKQLPAVTAPGATTLAAAAKVVPNNPARENARA